MNAVIQVPPANEMIDSCGLCLMAEAKALAARPAGPEDEEFLFSVYASSRSDETALMPWGQDQIDFFLRSQCEAQRRDYEKRFPQGAHEIILHDGRPIGGLWTARTAGELRLLDVTLLEEHRGRGIGTLLMQSLQRQAAALHLPLRLCAWKMHPHTIGFYRRLGFAPVEDLGIYLEMEWLPETVQAPGQPSTGVKE
jgi:GNAT superfamily N-acetyltransferase